MAAMTTTEDHDFDRVGEMYEYFELIDTATKAETVPHDISSSDANFRLRFLHEELNELTKGYEADDLAQIADALVDLVVVALGTAQLHGLPWTELFDEVHRANMKKIAGLSAKERGPGHVDLLKPDGWQAPNIEKVLMKHGWKGQ